MTANNSNCYLLCLKKLVLQCSNNYRHSINKKHINADYCVLTKKTDASSKFPN